jgi:hypothetical protein
MRNRTAAAIAMNAHRKNQSYEEHKKRGLLSLLAGGEAIGPAVEIAQREERRLLIRWLVGPVRNPETWPLCGGRAFEALTRTHTCTCVAK